MITEKILTPRVTGQSSRARAVAVLQSITIYHFLVFAIKSVEKRINKPMYDVLCVFSQFRFPHTEPRNNPSTVLNYSIRRRPTARRRLPDCRFGKDQLQNREPRTILNSRPCTLEIDYDYPAY